MWLRGAAERVAGSRDEEAMAIMHVLTTEDGWGDADLGLTLSATVLLEEVTDLCPTGCRFVSINGLLSIGPQGAVGCQPDSR